MNFKEFLDEVRDYSGSSRSYSRRQDYINRKKREKLKTGESDDESDNTDIEDNDSSVESQKEKTSPEYGTTKK